MRLNCDLGESFGPWKMGLDEVVMPYLHMANIACGFHASDPLVMDRTVALARQHKVTIGAHPGYPDLAGFGRRTIDCSLQEVSTIVSYQVGALEAICRRHKARVEYVKPHGALYNNMMQDDRLLHAVMQAVAHFDPDMALVLMGTSRNDHYREMAKKYGLPLWFEFFCDRAYTDKGLLLPRGEPGAVLHDQRQIVQRVDNLLQTGTVTTASGKRLTIDADTICVHGDNEESVQVARQLRALIDAA